MASNKSASSFKKINPAPLCAVFVMFLLAACNLPVTVSLVWPTPPVSPPVETLPPGTPTPFRPLPVTSQPGLKSETPSNADSPLPEETLPQPQALLSSQPLEASPAPHTLPLDEKIPSSTPFKTNTPLPTRPKINTFFPSPPQPMAISTTMVPSVTPFQPPTSTASLIPPTISPAATPIPPSLPPTPTHIPPTIPPPPPPTPVNTSIPSTSPPATCAAMGNTAEEQALFNLINQERANQGLSSLNWQSQLAAAARLHSTDMACKNFFSHTGSNGSTFDQRIRAQGYSFSYAAENRAAGGGSQVAFNSWMNSPGHRTNMLNPNLSEIGIGYMFNSGAAYGSYFTADFGAP
ncbi:MAG: hypothetical protein IT308_11755 [Anaerolineaceae bacterium]|nr:hypothetical protein [Anaerolineaceae bacterium]